MTVLEGIGLTCVAGGRTIVDDVSLSVSAGERVALVGPSGSGKTTLLTVLGGLLTPRSGRVVVDGGSGNGKDVAIVFQGYGLVSLLTAAENLEVALRAAGVRPPEAMRAAAEHLAALDVGSHADHLIEELSGGQQQRVAIARALALRPRILLADEPTAEQDADHRELVLDRLFEAAAAGAALIVATHDGEVADRCDRVLSLHEGRWA